MKSLALLELLDASFIDDNDTEIIAFYYHSGYYEIKAEDNTEDNDVIKDLQNQINLLTEKVNKLLQ